MVTYFVQLSNRRVETRSARGQYIYSAVAQMLREEDVTALAIPMSFARLGEDVWVTFRIPGVGEISCRRQIVPWSWAAGPGWRVKDTLAHYGAWGREEALADLEAAIRAHHKGEYPEWEA